MIGSSLLASEIAGKGKSETCPVIDVHTHLGPFYGAWMPKAAIEGLIGTMDQAGVQMSLLCPHSALFSPDYGNEETLAIAHQYRDRIRGYLGINPNYPKAIERDLARFEEHAEVLAGLKMLASYHQLRMDAPAFTPAWEFANAKGLLVLCHTWGGDGSAEALQKIAPRYPNARIIMAHALHGQWDDAISMAQAYPNLYLDLCAVLDDRGPLERFVEAGLTQRLLFGTDNPWYHPHHGIGALLSADLTDDDRQDILYRNAQRLLAETGVTI